MFLQLSVGQRRHGALAFHIGPHGVEEAGAFLQRLGNVLLGLAYSLHGHGPGDSQLHGWGGEGNWGFGEGCWGGHKLGCVRKTPETRAH